MRIDTLLQQGEPVFSFEFFPPKSPAGSDELFRAITHLRALQPGFVSVTDGAAGGHQNGTFALVRRINDETGLTAMAHLTCVSRTREQLHERLREIADAGLENVLALRGDPPAGTEHFTPDPNGLLHGSDLARLISEAYDLCIGCACYPEPHLECRDMEKELQYAAEKVNAGASFLITQLFFDNRLYFDFVRRARKYGISVPIIPGIMPVTNVAQIERFTGKIGATIPSELLGALRERQDDPDAVLELGVAWATLQCSELLSQGAPGIHFYTLNRSAATRAILSALRVARPWVKSPVTS